MHSERRRLHAGTARVEITPPVGHDLSGYVARTHPSTGVHDPLYVRSLVLDNGEVRAALVVCDLLGLTSDFVAGARRSISSATGIPQGTLMIACTHTHSGPATLFLHECGRVGLAYLDTVQASIVEAVCCAAAALQPVEIGIGWGAFPQGLYNRRGDGSSVDAGVGAAHLRTPSGETIAVLATYGCHPVVLDHSNLLVSADYPGPLLASLEDALGGSAFFLTGACGNTDPVHRGGFEEVRWLGERLADEVLQAISGMQYSETHTLAVIQEVLPLPLQGAPSAETLNNEIAKHRQLLNAAHAGSAEARVHRAMLIWAESTLEQLKAGRASRTVDAEVQLLRIGPLAIVGVPAELFSTLGWEIRANRPNLPAHIFVVGYANGDVGYVPDPAAYATGGYEVDDAFKYYGYPAALSPEAGAALVATARRLLASTRH
jgi:neutral ceramidase